jgi:hypothetical protein
MTTFRVSLYARESLRSMAEVMALFSWHVILAATKEEAIATAMKEAGPYPWLWALLLWPANRITGSAARVDAFRFDYPWSPKEKP